MRGRVLFVAGAAIGYVLGAKAGRRRYDQIRSGAERFWNAPPVQKGVDAAQDFVKEHAPDVQAAVADGVKKAASKVTGRTDTAGDEPSPAI